MNDFIRERGGWGLMGIYSCYDREIGERQEQRLKFRLGALWGIYPSLGRFDSRFESDAAACSPGAIVN